MIRNLKVLGLALVALVAMSAMASSASAASFTLGADTVNIKKHQQTTNVLTVTGHTVSCTTLTLAGHAQVSGGSPTSVSALTLKPVHTGCTWGGGCCEAKVTGTGHYGESNYCDFVFHASGTTDIVCSGGAEITFDVGTCQVHFPAQTGVGPIKYTNTSGDMIIHLEINNLTGTHTDGFLCPFNGSGSFSNGILDGDLRAEGTNAEGGNVNISHDA